MIKICVLALFTGIVFGATFTLFKLPLPAPNALAGLLGIVGIYAGDKLIQLIQRVIA